MYPVHLGESGVDPAVCPVHIWRDSEPLDSSWLNASGSQKGLYKRIHNDKCILVASQSGYPNILISDAFWSCILKVTKWRLFPVVVRLWLAFFMQSSQSRHPSMQLFSSSNTFINMSMLWTNEQLAGCGGKRVSGIHTRKNSTAHIFGRWPRGGRIRIN